MIGYIFPTELLNKKINVFGLPYVIIHGAYNAEKNCVEKFNDHMIHCVYAGTFDRKKGGVSTAVEAALYLNDKYHIHILGFGDKNEENLLLSQISDISTKTDCKITFEGLKTGEDYKRFIQKCDIGLSTQNPDAPFNDTSFPSKILSYMSNGLRVVTVRIPAIESSGIGNDVYYYEKQQPQDVADAIKRVDFNDGYCGREMIENLSATFISELNGLLS